MKFCNHCGSSLGQLIPDGDNRRRFVCTVCESIHYQNPRIIAGCIAEFNQQILLCQRAIEPKSGLWTLPAGFMENEETTLQAATRETFEEATAKLSDIQLFCTYSIPHISQVYIIYRGTLVDGFAQPGIESLETQLFSEKDIPWNDLAFPVMTETLKLYFSDKQKNKYQTHNGEITKDSHQSLKTVNY